MKKRADRTPPRAPASPAYAWEFKPRFRRHAFGWRAQPAVQRVKEAVAEIANVARRDPVLAAAGAVIFLERVSPALEQVDSSSGAIGSAVSRAVGELSAIIAGAPLDGATREASLERLWAAHEADGMPYIERLGDCWGELCASPELASAWADRLLDHTRLAMDRAGEPFRFFRGTTACLSALLAAQRFQEIIDLLAHETFWPYRQWAVKALVALGRQADAIRFAESCRGRSTSDAAIDAVCEEILLSSGFADDAYRRYALRPVDGGSYAAAFRAVCAKYPHKAKRDVLNDFAATTPGLEGKWFAAAKAAGLLDDAITLARKSPADPNTLARAARDMAEKQPAFAVEAGLLALRGFAQGDGFDVTSVDVSKALEHTIRAATAAGNLVEARDRIESILLEDGVGAEFVRRVISRPT
jgi:hypothetical protein